MGPKKGLNILELVQTETAEGTEHTQGRKNREGAHRSLEESLSSKSLAGFQR